MEKILEKHYYNPSDPGSFSSIANLARAAGVSNREAKNWLLAQDTYTLHRLARKKFPRNRIYVDNKDELWQCDLCDMRTLSQYNDGYNYILTVIDVFSKFAWAIPLKSKHKENVKIAFECIFAGGRKPYNIQTDKGKEFINKEMVAFFKQNGINYYTTRNPDVKAAVIERFNRTLKQRMFRFLNFKNSYRFIDHLYELVDAYNHSFHSSIKMRPVDVDDTKVLQVWGNLYKDSRPSQKPRLKVGMRVRIARKKSLFEKGYETYFTEEIFKIVKLIKRPIPVYELEDLNGEKIDGLFYEYELQPVTVGKDKTYKIDKILGRRKKRGIREVLVSWKGYPPNFNSWVPESNLIDLR